MVECEVNCFNALDEFDSIYRSCRAQYRQSCVLRKLRCCNAHLDNRRTHKSEFIFLIKVVKLSYRKSGKLSIRLHWHHAQVQSHRPLQVRYSNSVHKFINRIPVLFFVYHFHIYIPRAIMSIARKKVFQLVFGKFLYTCFQNSVF